MPDYFDIHDCERLGTTPAAIQVRIAKNVYWFPASTVHPDSEVRHDDSSVCVGTLTVQSWIAQEKGLVEDEPERRRIPRTTDIPVAKRLAAAIVEGIRRRSIRLREDVAIVSDPDIDVVIGGIAMIDAMCDCADDACPKDRGCIAYHVAVELERVADEAEQVMGGRS